MTNDTRTTLGNTMHVHTRTPLLRGSGTSTEYQELCLSFVGRVSISWVLLAFFIEKCLNLRLPIVVYLVQVLVQSLYRDFLEAHWELPTSLVRYQTWPQSCIIMFTRTLVKSDATRGNKMSNNAVVRCGIGMKIS